MWCVDGEHVWVERPERFEVFPGVVVNSMFYCTVCGVKRLQMPVVENCVNCGGEGHLWDESACGDPDHCSPTYDCPACSGTGRTPA